MTSFEHRSPVSVTHLCIGKITLELTRTILFFIPCHQDRNIKIVEPGLLVSYHNVGWVDIIMNQGNIPSSIDTMYIRHSTRNISGEKQSFKRVALLYIIIKALCGKFCDDTVTTIGIDIHYIRWWCESFHRNSVDTIVFIVFFFIIVFEPVRSYVRMRERVTEVVQFQKYSMWAIWKAYEQFTQEEQQRYGT